MSNSPPPLRREMVELAGEKIGDMRAHPTPERVANIDVSALASRRYSRSKAQYLVDAAQAVAERRLDIENLGEGSAIAAEKALTAQRGIGTWTARYVLMRGGFADAAPGGRQRPGDGVATAAQAAGAARRGRHGAADEPRLRRIAASPPCICGPISRKQPEGGGMTRAIGA